MSDEIRKMPAEASEEQIGVTKAELDWKNLPDPRPPVSRWVFFFAGMTILIACIISGIWYYNTSIIPEKLFARGENYLMDGRYADAYNLFEHVYERRPKRKDVIYNIGRCLEAMESYEPAANRYREHINKAPYDGRAIQTLGALYFYKMDKKDEGYALLIRGAEKLDTAEGWENTAQAADGFKDIEEVAAHLTKALKYAKKSDVICRISQKFYDLEKYKEALEGFEKALDKDKKSAQAAEGIKAAKTALGLPDSPEHTIIAQKSIGKIEIGNSKKDLYKNMGEADKTVTATFRVKNEKGGTDEKQAEILYFGTKTADSIRAIICEDKVIEIETSSDIYKTEDGLCVANFDEERFTDKLEHKASVRRTAIFTAKDGGLTIYAQTNRSGHLTKHRALRVHAGDQSATDNADRLYLLNLREK